VSPGIFVGKHKDVELLVYENAEPIASLSVLAPAMGGGRLSHIPQCQRFRRHLCAMRPVSVLGSVSAISEYLFEHPDFKKFKFFNIS